MIFFGVTTRCTPTETGTFDCPACATSRGYRRISFRRWWTLYFIPVIPLGSCGERVECLDCGSQFSPDSLTPRSAEPRLAETVDGNAQRKSEFVNPVPLKSGTPVAKSRLAFTSLYLALVSPILTCFCGLSVVTSLAAIVTGHMSLVAIKRSKGQLIGRGRAIGGLVIGYLMFGVSVLILALVIPGLDEDARTENRRHENADGLASQTRSKRLYRAERNVISAVGDGRATGNSPAARELAESYAMTMKVMREAMFTADKDRVISLTDGEFVTHCELHEDRCAFIVHVPAYRRFEESAKDQLAEMAWDVARRKVETVLDANDQLAVGLRGSLFYGAVMVGRAGSDDEDQANFELVKRDRLLEFFPTSDAGETEIGDSQEQVLEQTAPEPEAVAPVPSDPVIEPPSQDGGRTPQSRVSPQPLRETQRTNSQVSVAVAPPRRLASRNESVTSDLKVASPDFVQEFPDMGWPVESLAFDPRGRWIAAGKLDRALLILGIEKGITRSSEDTSAEIGSVTQVAFSPDGEQVAASGSNGAVRIWKIGSDGVLRDGVSLRGHTRRVECLVMSPAAPLLMTGSSHGELVWQSYGSGTTQSRTRNPLSRPVVACHLPRSGIVAKVTDGRILVNVDLKTSEVTEPQEIGRGPAHAAAFSRDGSQLAITAGYEIQIVDTTSGALLRKLNAGREIQWSVAFLPDGDRVISGGRGQVTLWHVASGHPTAHFDLRGTYYVKALAISYDGTMFAAIPASAGQTLSVVRIPD